MNDEMRRLGEMSNEMRRLAVYSVFSHPAIIGKAGQIDYVRSPEQMQDLGKENLEGLAGLINGSQPAPDDHQAKDIVKFLDGLMVNAHSRPLLPFLRGDSYGSPNEIAVVYFREGHEQYKIPERSFMKALIIGNEAADVSFSIEGIAGKMAFPRELPCIMTGADFQYLRRKGLNYLDLWLNCQNKAGYDMQKLSEDMRKQVYSPSLFSISPAKQ